MLQKYKPTSHFEKTLEINQLYSIDTKIFEAM